MRDIALGKRLFVLALAGILPLAFMSGVGLLVLVKQQRAQAERGALEITRALATAVDSELQRSTSVLETLATSVTLDTRDPAAFRLAADRMMKAQPHWLTTILADPGGNVLVNTGLPAGRKTPRIAERDSFDLAIASRKPVIGYLARGARGQFGVPLRVPVVRDGELRYVLTSVIRPQAILDIVDRQRVPGDWVISVFDAVGARVARSRAHDEYLGARPSPSLQALMDASGPEGFGITTVLEGTKAYTAYTRSPATGWSVAIGVPEAAIDGVGLRSLAAYGGGLLFSLVLGVVVSLTVARSINRPISDLRKAAQALGRGEPFTLRRGNIPETREVADALVTAMNQHARNAAERERLLADTQAARRQAEKANLIKDEFLAMLGHELRNPLAPIVSALDLMKLRNSPHDVRERRVIERQVVHLTRLVDDLLDVSRISKGKLQMRFQCLDLNTVAARALELAGPALEQRARPLEVVLAPAPVMIEGDAVRLAQVLTNLLSNAAKFTREQDRITLRVGVVDGMAQARVEDEGSGIGPELLPRVFDLFTQGKQSLDRNAGGLGLGLAIVKTLVELHGGEVSAASAGMGKGSTFTVRLPLWVETGDAGADEHVVPASRARRGKKILIVDDNADAAETLAFLLAEAAGYDVKVAADGPDALALLDEFLPDVAVLDIGLPGMDGYELAEKLRDDPRAPGLRIVAVTGYGTEQDRERALRGGFDDHLVKPVALERLVGAIERDAPVMK